MPDPVFLSGDAVPDYLHGVELMTAGMEWQASTGPVTITLEHIADAIAAANDDPHIQPPRIKLGHTSQINGDHPDHDPFAALGDAEPAFGVFANLGATNDGAVLTGDADRILTWLALSAPATYPNRSSEATWQVAGADFDVQTAGGKRYSMVVTAVSLLGVYLPAITDLEDLSTLIMDGPSALAKADPAAALGRLFASLKAGTDLAAIPAADLSVSTDTIVSEWFDWRDEDASRMWWWPRDVRLNPTPEEAGGNYLGVVLADDDEGHLNFVPFGPGGEWDGTFGEPVPRGPAEYPPAVSAAKVVAMFSRPKDMGHAPAKPQRPPVAAGTPPAASPREDPEPGATMDEPVRQFLVGRGVDPDAATEAQITAAEQMIAAFPVAPSAEAEEPETPEGESGDAPEGESVEEPEAERAPVAAARQIPDGMSLIDSATLEDLKAGAADGTRLAREKATETRDRVLAAARDEGRFPPSRLAAYSKMYDADPDGTTVLLTAAEDKGGLAKGTVPLAARAQTPDPEAAAFAADQPLPAGVSILSPSERAESRARHA